MQPSSQRQREFDQFPQKWSDLNDVLALPPAYAVKIQHRKFHMTLKILSELHTHPHLDISAAMGRYARGEAMFGEINDQGEPPAFAGTAHRDFPLDFETVLGFYDADERRITCFSKGITFVAETLNVHNDVVERIVRYHEYAHALHHLGIAQTNVLPKEAAELLRKKNESYRRASDETKEQIAQLATLIVIRTRRQDVSSPDVKNILDLIRETFFALMQRQSPRYQLPLEMKDVEARNARRCYRHCYPCHAYRDWGD